MGVRGEDLDVGDEINGQQQEPQETEEFSGICMPYTATPPAHSCAPSLNPWARLIFELVYVINESKLK
jgi:hypothetical protein